METIFDVYSKEEIEVKINEIRGLIQNGYKDDEILAKIDFQLKEELLSIARARIKEEKDFGKNIGDAKYYNSDDLRFSTPIVVAEYRAKRMKCNKIVDLCSGIGVQANAFAKKIKEVYAFEIDPKKVRYSEENFSAKNLKFFVGDVLSEEIIEKIRGIKPDIIFCDPERLAKESERTLESIKPDLKKLVEIYSKITSNICIEMPPQIELSKLKPLGKFEAEYLNFNNKLNRLDIFFGKLNEAERSVVDILSGIKIVNNSQRKPKYTRDFFDYIYEVSDSVIKAGLVSELAHLDSALIVEGSEKNKVILTSKEPSLEFGCFARPYEIIGVAEGLGDVKNILRKNRFGKVVIKYSIDPKDYWKERNLVEKDLSGNRTAVIFKINNSYVICEELD